MTMTIAGRFMREFRLIPRDPETCRADAELLAGFRARLRHAAVTKLPTDSRSYDPTETYVFADGSRAMLDNPRQAAFHAALRIRDADNRII